MRPSGTARRRLPGGSRGALALALLGAAALMSSLGRTVPGSRVDQLVPAQGGVQAGGNATAAAASSSSGRAAGEGRAVPAFDPIRAHRRGTYSLFTLPQRVKGRMDRAHNPEARHGGRTEKWGSCAVVGNSGALLERPMGALIDAHEAVLRLNNAPVLGRRAVVGAKTNVSVVNGWKLEACSPQGQCTRECFPYGEHVALLVHAFQPNMRQLAHTCQHAHPGWVVQPVDGGLLRLLGTLLAEYETKRIKQHPREQWEAMTEERRRVKLTPSTGIQAVLLALGLCERVSLFGFGGGADTAGQHHYYENDTLQEIPDHSYAAEMLFYRDLENGTAPLGREVRLPPVAVH